MNGDVRLLGAIVGSPALAAAVFRWLSPRHGRFEDGDDSLLVRGGVEQLRVDLERDARLAWPSWCATEGTGSPDGTVRKKTSLFCSNRAVTADLASVRSRSPCTRAALSERTRRP
jgi:hypothetical protein